MVYVVAYFPKIFTHQGSTGIQARGPYSIIKVRDFKSATCNHRYCGTIHCVNWAQVWSACGGCVDVGVILRGSHKNHLTPFSHLSVNYLESTWPLGCNWCLLLWLSRWRTSVPPVTTNQLGENFRLELLNNSAVLKCAPKTFWLA